MRADKSAGALCRFQAALQKVKNLAVAGLKADITLSCVSTTRPHFPGHHPVLLPEGLASYTSGTHYPGQYTTSGGEIIGNFGATKLASIISG